MGFFYNFEFYLCFIYIKVRVDIILVYRVILFILFEKCIFFLRYVFIICYKFVINM